MLFAIEELKRSLMYHQKQHEENMQNIKRKQESIELLYESSDKHLEIIEQIREAIKQLEKGISCQTENPGKNIDTGIIPQEGAM